MLALMHIVQCRLWTEGDVHAALCMCLGSCHGGPSPDALTSEYQVPATLMHAIVCRLACSMRCGTLEATALPFGLGWA